MRGILKIVLIKMGFVAFFLVGSADAVDLRQVIFFDGIYKGAFAGSSATNCPQKSSLTESDDIEDHYFNALCEAFDRRDWLELFGEINSALTTKGLITFDAISESASTVEDGQELDFCQLNIAFFTLDKVFVFLEEEKKGYKLTLIPFVTFYVVRGADRKVVYSRQTWVSFGGSFDVDGTKTANAEFIETLAEERKALTDDILNDVIRKAVNVQQIEKRFENEALLAEENLAVVQAKILPKVKRKDPPLLNDFSEYELFSSYVASSHFGKEIALLPFQVGDEKYSAHIEEIILRAINHARAAYNKTEDAGQVFAGNPCGAQFNVGEEIFPAPKNKIEVWLRPQKIVPKKENIINLKTIFYRALIFVKIGPIQKDAELGKKLKKGESPPLVYKDNGRNVSYPKGTKESDIYLYTGLMNAFTHAKTSIFEHYKNVPEVKDLFEWL